MKTNLIDNRQIRVFISSTFQDMQDERDYLMKRTFPMLRKLAAERDVTLTELDLRWGITEEESKSGKVVEICLREIENSIPFFIGIIGNRYGWVPEKKDISENVTDRFKDVNSYLEHHLSVTEMEMQFGVLQRQEDMHAFFYIKEGEDKKDADNPEMLERLKKEVKASRYPSSTYSSPENLAQQVEKAFSALLDQLFPEGHLSELEKERIGQRSFMNQLCQNYIRDDKNFQVIDEWMSDWDQHQLVITGASGLGKSALIANWLKEKLSDEKRDYNIIYHFTGNGGSESSHEYIMKTLVDEINDVYGWDARDEVNKSQKDKQDDELNDLFIKVASEGKKPLLIVFDAINQIIDTDNAKLLNWLPIPPKNIKILFSTLEDDRTMEVFRNRHYPEFVLQPLGIDSRKQLVTNYLYLYGKKLTDQQVERISKDKQCENTLVLKTLLDELINFGIYEKLDDRIDYYLSQDTIEDFYQALLQSYEDDYDSYSEDFVKQVLSLIVLSRNGLSEDEILKATDIKPLYWSQFYCAFSNHLVSKEGLISFSHRFVHEAVSARYTHNEDWIHTCRNEILSVVNEANTIRYLEEQTFQLNQLGEYVKLHDLLLDYETFRTYYKVHPYELGDYWRKLTSLGYSISEYLQIEDNSISGNDKAAYFSNFGKFSSRVLADYDNALEYHKQALDIRERVLGKENTDTAGSYENIGNVYYNLGNYQKALEYHKQALDIRVRVLGKDHPDTAMSYNNIGNVYAALGEYSKALDYYRQALEIEERVLGKDHPDTAGSYDNIGNVYYNLGNYQKAMENNKQALNVYERVLGKDHPDTAGSYNNIGVTYYALGEYNKSEEYHKQALDIRERVLGKDHPDTAFSYNNIGYVYFGLGEYGNSLEYLKEALGIRERLLGKNHPDTATSYNDIGNVYAALGEYSKALDYYRQALDIRERALGKDHPYTASSYKDIGTIFKKLGDYNKALKYYRLALDIREKVLSKNHPDTASSYNNIANVYFYLCDYDKALDYYKQALDIRKKTMGKDHLATATSCNDIGAVYSVLGDYEMALYYFKLALGIREKVMGKDHPVTAGSYNNIGNVYYYRGDYDKALDYYKLAQNIEERVLGKDHPDTADSYDNIGNVYAALGEYSKALDYVKQALDIREKVLGKNHPLTARSYNELAWTYHLTGKYEEALPWAEKAVDASPQNPGIIDTLATVYQGLGRYDEALEQFELCFKLKKEQGESEESINRTETKIAELKELMK